MRRAVIAAVALLVVLAGVAAFAVGPRATSVLAAAPGNPTQLTPADNGTGISATPTIT